MRFRILAEGAVHSLIQKYFLVFFQHFRVHLLYAQHFIGEAKLFIFLFPKLVEGQQMHLFDADIF